VSASNATGRDLAKHAGFPLRRVRAVEAAGRLSLHLKAGPPARQRHDGHRGTGLTLPPAESQNMRLPRSFARLRIARMHAQ
jgi:hypothetical protein